MANRGLDLTIEEELLENPSRRRFLENTSIAILGLASSSAHALDSYFGSTVEGRDKYVADISSLLKNDLKEKRNIPQLLMGLYGDSDKRADYDQHVYRGAGRPDSGGLDFGPVADIPEIVPAASGHILRTVDDNPGSGMFVLVQHPFGYSTSYHHLSARYEIPNRPQAKVERNNVIAVMGSSGSNARRIHLHLSLWGPAYTKYLSGIKVQERYSTSLNLHLYNLDPEQFSIAGKGSELPYQRLDDKLYDENSWKRHFDAQNYLKEVLNEFPKAQVEIKKSPSQRRLERALNIRTIDREIEFILSAISLGKYKSLFSKNDEEKILKVLRGYMQEVPRLTAPIKEREKEENYQYLSNQKVTY